VKRVGVLQVISLVGLLLLLAPPLLAQSVPESSLLQLSAEERLASVQSAYGTALSDAQKTRLSNVCSTVQGILKQYVEKSTAASENENSIYSGIITRIGSMQAQFGVSNIENAEFDEVVREYSVRLNNLKTSYELHHALLGDAIAMDCTANPVGFKALIAAAKAAHPDIVTKRTSIKLYTADVVRPAIELIKTDLQKDSSTSQDGNSSSEPASEGDTQ
jgi:hypothetical protein